jgi:threonine/homoserine/homoserine lactone efflux protein
MNSFMALAHTIHHLFVVGLVLVAGYFIWTAYSLYRKAEGTPFQRVIAAGQGSLTIFWQTVVMLAGALVAGITWISQNLLSDPTLTTAIQQYLTPQTVGAVMIGICVLTVLTRKRTL